MKTTTTCVAITIILLLAGIHCVRAEEADTAALAGTTASEAQHSAFEFRLRMDPETTNIEPLPAHAGESVDGRFSLVKATCVNCNEPCPGFGRTVNVVLRANENIDAGYAVSSLMSANFAIDTDRITYSTREALAASDRLTITMTGDLLTCRATNLFFSMCDTAPARVGDACPGVTRP